MDRLTEVMIRAVDEQKACELAESLEVAIDAYLDTHDVNPATVLFAVSCTLKALYEHLFDDPVLGAEARRRQVSILIDLLAA